MKRLFACALLLCMLLPLTAALTASAETASPLNGKRVLFVGDSICEAICEKGDATYGRTMGWAGRIIKEYDMIGLNLGYSGASVSNCRGWNTILSQLQRQQTQQYDMIILHGGVNDAWDNAPVGQMTEGFDGPFDLTTFAGGLEDLFRYAKKTFEGAQLGYIINFRLTRAGIGSLSDMSAYFDEAIKICEKWEIPYLDLYHDEDFNRNVMKVHTTENLPDLIHPNSAGYNLLAPVIGAWMETLCEEVPVEPEESVEPEASEENAPSEPEVSEPSEPETGSDYTLLIVLIIVGAVVVAGGIAIAAALIPKKQG